jgi:hypothetical protein
MIPSGKRPDGTQGYRVLTPEEYIARSEKLLVEDGFRERELHRVVERFGPLVHVFNSYEGRREGDTKPFVRGINSIQAVHDGKRWWLLTVAPLPKAWFPVHEKSPGVGAMSRSFCSVVALYTSIDVFEPYQAR